MYDNLFNDPDPAGAAADSGDDFVDLINAESLRVATAMAEPALSAAQPGERFQFERLGYFCADPDSKPGAPVFQPHHDAARQLGPHQPATRVANPMIPNMSKPKAPPIKTQGIKTKLVPFIADHVDWEWNGRWVEPFLGSGAVLLNIRPKRALVADSCVPIIDFYRAIQRGQITAAVVEAYLQREGELLRVEGSDRYYQIRERFNNEGDPLDFLFVSRACFNGLMRFNRKGQFNTPFCKKTERFRQAYVTKICNQVQWASNAMRGRDWDFVCADWRTVIETVNEEDFIYADPPYSGRFTDYYNSWSDQEGYELAQALKNAPCRFLYSMWVENRFRRNDRLFDWFDGYENCHRFTLLPSWGE